VGGWYQPPILLSRTTPSRASSRLPRRRMTAWPTVRPEPHPDASIPVAPKGSWAFKGPALARCLLPARNALGSMLLRAMLPDFVAGIRRLSGRARGLIGLPTRWSREANVWDHRLLGYKRFF